MTIPEHPSKRKALIILSSARALPLREPADHAPISTGFFLVELAQILKEFEGTHAFTFCTPDGATPQLDINGMSLPFMATDRLTGAMASQMLAPGGSARRRPDLVARRNAELELGRRHLGPLPVSDSLPNTDPEAADLRDEIVASFGELATKDYLSAKAVVERHRDPNDDFSLADFDSIHFPGGHAPMADFRDSPWLGEIINLACEEKVLLSLICHAPVAMTSARFRVDQDGAPRDFQDHPFRGAKLTTVPNYGEVVALTTSSPKIPGQKTRLIYYVDEALKQAGYEVSLSLNPGAVRVIWEPHLRLLTSNGPQSVDAQAKQLRSIIG